MKKLQNKVALVTGGTSGIGYDTARVFIEEGATVILTGRFKKTVDDAVERLGSNAHGLVSDAASMNDILLLADQVRLIAIKLDILFVNAGYGRFAPIDAVTEDMFDELFNVLVKGSFFTVQGLLPLMEKGGSIIFNTSIVTQYGSSNASIYSAAKSAVSSFVKTLAAELVDRGIRVNAISPGYTNTNAFHKTGMSDEQINGIVEFVTTTLPFKRFAESLEVAKVVGFLASEDASYLHGAELVVDGGYTVIK
jgi:NAD(P)-dependent dehydrogenase (short-subunit alcohol dehydrogenase family)